MAGAATHLWGPVLERDAQQPHSTSPALEFAVRAQDGRARTAQMQLPHFLCETPMFMPVGTQGEGWKGRGLMREWSK